MNYGVLQSTLLARLNMGTDDPLAANVGGLVNEAIHFIETAHPAGWPYLRSTATYSWVAATNGIAFTTLDSTNTIRKITSVKFINSSIGFLLESSADEAINSYDWASTGYPTTGVSNLWWAEGSKLWVAPTPAATGTVLLRTVIAEPDLSADADEPLLPASYHSAILAAGQMLFYEQLQDQNRAEMANKRLSQWLVQMRTGLSKQSSGAGRIRVRDTGF